MSRAEDRGDPFALEPYLEEERARVGEALEDILRDLLPDLPEAIGRPIAHSVRAGGKRLRPILCATAFRASGRGGVGAAVYRLAGSLELIHTYSLMHDDLPCMDDAPLRRGQPTAHTVFGEAATTVAGAALIAAAGSVAWEALVALGVGEDTRRRVLVRLADASGARGMVGGQALDIDAEGRPLSREEIDRLHGMKTGALISSSLEIGAMAAEASEVRTQALAEYGRRIGLAFQIADDVLDATSSTGVLGKKPSDDALAKSTYVGLLGVEGARRRAEVQVDLAIHALDTVNLDSAALRALARYVVERAN